MEDKDLNCIDCGTMFIFSARDQEFYQRNNFSEPKRCHNCRKEKKQRYENKGNAPRFERRPRRESSFEESQNY